MIINDLINAYDRLAKNPDCPITRDGFCHDIISNFIVIDKDGNLKEIVRNDSKTRERLPENLKKNTTEAWLLYDKLDYILGLDIVKGESCFREATDQSGRKKFDIFKAKNLEFFENIYCPVADAIKNFLNKWEPSENETAEQFYIADKNENLKQRKLDGYCAFVLDDINQKSYLDTEIIKNFKPVSGFETKKGTCAATGEYADITKNHKSIKLSGPQGKDAHLISADKATQSFQSYNKTEGYNSPISVEAMNKYTAALNYFYRQGSKNKTRLGDDTLIFWAECDGEEYQEDFLSLIGVSETQSSEEQVEEQIGSSISQIKKGIAPDETDDNIKFHILIISPNAARLSVKRYYNTSFGTLKANIEHHYEDMRLQSSKQIPLWQILDATISSVITQKRSSSVNPNFCTALAEAVFNNTKYPTEVFAEMIARIKTDNASSDDSKRAGMIRFLTKTRVAYIKAYLVRKNRLNNFKENITMSLNLDNHDEAYLLGRLFAVMEKTQEDALNNPNSTIKDRFFAAACSTPATTFPALLIGYQNHIQKLDSKGVRYEKLDSKGVRYEKLIQEIISKLSNTFPKTLNLDKQGTFIIGYYQQRTALWTKQEDKAE